ncbi:MarR family transcriptional regulator [uncultured Tateyamaria sp.]|nr:MarR family transcriptional regulator [uncultured Tateyamaria sp.]
MTKEKHLLEYVHVLMRVMLVSERTAPEHQHVIKFNPLDFHTLGLLREAPGTRASAVADALGVVPTTASSVIARLVKRGYVARTQSAQDRRAYDLTLTEDGMRVAQTIHQQDLRNMGLFLSALSEVDQDKLIEILGQVVSRVADLEGRAT